MRVLVSHGFDAIPKNFICVGLSRILVSHALSYRISLGFNESSNIAVALCFMHKALLLILVDTKIQTSWVTTAL